MKGISKKEMNVIASLEYEETYFFTSKDINKFVKSNEERYNLIKNLKNKGRIIKINRDKYYLIPIKAKTGKWSEHPFIIIDEICNSNNYLIGGWSAANYWKLTDQIPFQMDVYTSRRQGKIKILSTTIVFHRTTKNKIQKSISRNIKNHSIKILSKRETKKWMKTK